MPTTYWQVDRAGTTYGPNSSQLPPGLDLRAPIVGMDAETDGGGHWLAAADGGVFAFGDAQYFGSAANLTLHAPIVGIATEPDMQGYWLVASDGGVFAYGNARFHGSAAGFALRAPIVGMAATPDGAGYWIVAADGGVFAFGDAQFHGSVADLNLHAPIVGIASMHSGAGYWLDGSDGGIFAFGAAPFMGAYPSAPGTIVGPPFPTPDDDGYWLLRYSIVGGLGEGFGDVAPCWGGSNTALGAGSLIPDIVGTAVAGAAQDPNPACLV